MTYDFVKKRHALFEIPENLIFDLVKRAIGVLPVRKNKIVEGNDNEVYDVETDKGNVIVRIHRFGSVGYQEEAWALEQCKKLGVPVPEVLLMDTIELDGERLDAMVQNRLRGKDFKKVIDTGISKKERERVLFAAGELLRKIHTIQVAGFYRLHGDGQWDFRSWEAVMDSSLRGRASEKELIMSTGFTEGEFVDMMRFHKMYAQDFPCRQPVLCHGDYTPEHWFVDEDLNITGIIDFGDMQGGPAILDLALFEYFEPELDPTAFLKGYGIHETGDPQFRKQLNLQKLTLQMGYLAHFVKQKNTEEIQATVPLLRNTLNTLQTS